MRFSPKGTGSIRAPSTTACRSGSSPASSIRPKAWSSLTGRGRLDLMRGPRTSGAMAPEIPLDNQRPADFVFRRHVDHAMTRLKAGKPILPEPAETAAAAD